MAVTVSSTHSAIASYLAKTDPDAISPGFLAYIANLSQVASVAPNVARGIVQELADQRAYLKLIASENYCSLATQAAMGNLLTDKYAEGFPGTRFYEGCDNIDDIEAYACAQACKLFGCDHAYVQPHSGADANMVAFWAILQARIVVPKMAETTAKDPGALSHGEWERIRQSLGNQRLLGLNLAAGGHLTHGYRHNVSGKMFEAFSYGVHPETHLLDYDEIEKQALEVKPLILLAGYSAYPRAIDFKRMRAIADKVGAVLMVDMAHFAGLVAGGVFTGDFSPFPHAHIVTSTTHKTLRGPRGGVVLSTKEFAEYVDKGCPMVLGGPLSHIMAAKGVAFTEANTPAFKTYAHKIVENAKALAESCASEGMKVISGGTDNHLMLIDATTFGLTGRQAASALRECGITLNKNTIPFDQNTPLITSGLRLGTPAITTLGMGIEEMKEIAGIIKLALSNTKPGVVESGANAGKPSKINYTIDAQALETAKARVKELLDRYPVYPELDLGFLLEHFG
ncbi:MAG TPA: glycine hydroxymethyltransferase [Candidatus Hydrogenedentes bacterium]|nr:glycine hydroxymethyltransferase [Candidatus Hydrogenedentota bacterium]